MVALTNYIRRLDPRTEFILVVTGAFGFLILKNILFITGHSSFSIDNDHLSFLLVYELTLISLLGTFLYLRGWSTTGLGLHPVFFDVITGIGLYLVGLCCAILIFLFALVFGFFDTADLPVLTSHNLNITYVLLVSLVTPFFEEIFVCGYVVHFLKSIVKPGVIVITSVGIRMLYHLYQEAYVLISILPMGVVFAIWVLSTGRLFPVIIAHFIWDLAGLLPGIVSDR